MINKDRSSALRYEGPLTKSSNALGLEPVRILPSGVSSDQLMGEPGNISNGVGSEIRVNCFCDDKAIFE